MTANDAVFSSEMTVSDRFKENCVQRTPEAEERRHRRLQEQVDGAQPYRTRIDKSRLFKDITTVALDKKKEDRTPMNTEPAALLY